MKIKSAGRYVIIHALFFVLGTTTFIFLVRSPLFGGGILFYRGIALLGLATLLAAFGWVYFKKSRHGKVFSFQDILLSIVLIFCLNLVGFTHLPVTAERSVTVFILGYMDNYPDKAFSKEEITNVFTQKYLVEQQNIEKRFNEQVVSKTITEDTHGYRISSQGVFLMKIYNFTANLFKLDKQNLSSE